MNAIAAAAGTAKTRSEAEGLRAKPGRAVPKAIALILLRFSLWKSLSQRKRLRQSGWVRRRRYS
jgi:hypothetical protein